MVPLRSRKLLIACACVLVFAACEKKYQGNITVGSHTWLKGKKIFIDPGHGGTAAADSFRSGPGGLTEEEVNLAVSLHLASMLRGAGAVVALAREKDLDVPLIERVRMAREFSPDLFLSVHHNGTMRRMDGVNYPCVLVWGSPGVSPASFDFANLLLGEFHRIMDARGSVLSDFSVFPETGSMMLRETHDLCPGIIGEAGFFSDERHAIHLRDAQYREHEAGAYFNAVSEYFRRGVPSARAQINCRVENTGYLKNLLKDREPAIMLLLDPGAPGVDIDDSTIRVTLDNIPVTASRMKPGRYSLDYGRRLYPGAHRIRLEFANTWGRRAMIVSLPFHVAVQPGEHDALVREGTRLASYYYTAREGLKMLQAALSMTVTAPDADMLLWRIAQGFGLIGAQETSRYYFSKIAYFYPQSEYQGMIGRYTGDLRYPVEYHGKEIQFTEDCPACPSKNTVREIPVIEPRSVDGKQDEGFYLLEKAKALFRSLREQVESWWTK